MATKKQAEEGKEIFSSGATSSEQCVPYHLVTSIFKAAATRFGVGAVKHGDVNYQKCIHFSEDGRVKVLDIAFARDRYNHFINHTLNIKEFGVIEPDGGNNFHALAWGLDFMLWVEKHGFNWHRILNPRYINEIELAIMSDKNLRKKNGLWVKTKDIKNGTTKCYHEV